MNDETTGKLPDESGARFDDDAAAGSPEAADDEQTAVTPSPEEGATHVMSGEAADVTRVMPAAGGAEAPPPPRPQPTLMMSRPEKEGSVTRWWIVLAIVVLVGAGAAALWFFVLRDDSAPAPPPVAWSGAWGRVDGVGGGLVVEKTGSGYRVTAYDSSLRPSGTAAATTSSDGRQLLFTLPAQSSFGGITGPLRSTLTIGSSRDSATLRMTGASQTSISMPLQRVLALVPVSPSASPSPSVTASPSPSSTGSPSPSSSPIGAADQQVIDAVIKIQVGVITWATNNNNLYPMSAEVSQSGGVAQYVNPWPTNPFTGQAMAPGTGPGGYTYEQLNGGQGYKLTGYLDKGLTYTVP
jgi:hypothetical protein